MSDERAHLRNIEKAIRCELEIVKSHPFRSTAALLPAEQRPAKKQKSARRTPRKKRYRGRAVARSA